jgi:hypothetical protein
MAPIIRAPQTLLVRDNDVRRSSTNFDNLVADILAGQLKEPTSRRDIGIINSGRFRIDRNIEKNEPISRHHAVRNLFSHERHSAILVNRREDTRHIATQRDGEFLH